MRIGRFLHNRRVTAVEMLETARERTCARSAGRHVLAVDAHDGTALGLVDAIFLSRAGGLKGLRRQRDFADKDSRR